MTQSRAIHSLVDDHRRDLIASAVPRRSVEADGAPAVGAQRRARRPVTGGRATRHAVAPRVGSWLIGLGTKMGGASIRTS
jgi:hypothetical protein